MQVVLVVVLESQLSSAALGKRCLKMEHGDHGPWRNSMACT